MFNFVSIVWLIGLFTFAIDVGMERFNTQVNICGGSLLTKDETKDENIMKAYDSSMASFSFTAALIYTIISSGLVLALIIYILVLLIKGKDWIEAKKNKKSVAEESNASLL